MYIDETLACMFRLKAIWTSYLLWEAEGWVPLEASVPSLSSSLIAVWILDLKLQLLVLLFFINQA
jgi:hypothetical protein